MKICHRCKIEKEEKEFWKGCSYCVTCDKEYRKEWREKNKHAYAERRKYLWRKQKGRICKNCQNVFVGKGRTRDYCSTKCKLLNLVEKKNGCWNWLGELHPSGYGYTTCHETYKRSHAHRVSYKVFKGEIPEGMYVCHHCDNPRCINPDHLWIGSAKENMQDAKKKGRLKGGKRKKEVDSGGIRPQI